MNSLIKSATIIDKNSEFHNKSVDILIKNGIISDISENIKNSKNYSEISFPNLHVSNGWFDYSVCSGEPGYEERDNLLNTLKVASKSGFTSVGLQPNTFPVTEKSTEIEYLKATAKNSNIDIYNSFEQEVYNLNIIDPATTRIKNSRFVKVSVDNSTSFFGSINLDPGFELAAPISIISAPFETKLEI